MFWLRSKWTLTQMTCDVPPSFFPLVNVYEKKSDNNFSNASFQCINCHSEWLVGRKMSNYTMTRVLTVECLSRFITCAWVRTTLMALKINRMMHSKFYRNAAMRMHVWSKFASVNRVKNQSQSGPEKVKRVIS